MELKLLQSYRCPASLDDALRTLKQDPDSAVLAGGTDLLVTPPGPVRTVIDISRLGLDQITEAGGEIRIGARVTMSRLAHDPITLRLANGILAQAAAFCMSELVRNAATVGGNLANAAAEADLPAPLLVLDAEVLVAGGSRKAIVLDDFFTGPRATVLNREIITEVVVQAPSGTSGASFHKMGRTDSDIALVNAAALVVIAGGTCRKARVAVGGAWPFPARSRRAEKALEGHALTAELLDAAALLAQREQPALGDFRASAEYRAGLVRVLVRRALEEAARRAGVAL